MPELLPSKYEESVDSSGEVTLSTSIPSIRSINEDGSSPTDPSSPGDPEPGSPSGKDAKSNVLDEVYSIPLCPSIEWKEKMNQASLAGQHPPQLRRLNIFADRQRSL